MLPPVSIDYLESACKQADFPSLTSSPTRLDGC